MDLTPIAALASLQGGMVARRQLNAMGYDADSVRNQIAAGRWVARSSNVVSVFTGPLGWHEQVWFAVLHAGGTALVGGLTALEWHGLKNWHRDEITVLVDDELAFDPLEGVRFFRTRRALGGMRDPSQELPLCRVEPAALLFAGYERSARTAQGLLAAVVQQRLATPAGLGRQLEQMRPLRRAKLFRAALVEFEGGAQSMAELDIGRVCRRFGLPRPRRQTRRRDGSGRLRFTDCEWLLPNGMTLVLEIDGAFHMDVEHWEDDLARQRRIVTPGRVVVRCSARELRDEPELVVEDLIALGVPRSWGGGGGGGGAGPPPPPPPPPPRLEDDEGQREAPIVGEAQVHAQAGGRLGDGSAQREARPAVLVRDHLGLLPGQSRRRSEGLGERLLRGEPGRERLDGQACLRLREQAIAQGRCPLQRLLEPPDVDEVGADAGDHGRTVTRR
jgi:hypothetical protein